MGEVGSNGQYSLSGGSRLPQVSALAGSHILVDNILFSMSQFLFLFLLKMSFASLSGLLTPCYFLLIEIASEAATSTVGC